MTDLLLNHHLYEPKRSNAASARSIAQARTSTVLRDLNDMRRGTVVRFLQEAELIKADDPIVRLEGAHLQDAVLNGVDLTGANLEGALLIRAQLHHANLIGARLAGAYLMGRS